MVGTPELVHVNRLTEPLQKVFLDLDTRQCMGGMKKMIREFSVGVMATRMTRVYEDGFRAKELT